LVLRVEDRAVGDDLGRKLQARDAFASRALRGHDRAHG
jgi:hypothetical protein